MQKIVIFAVIACLFGASVCYNYFIFMKNKELTAKIVYQEKMEKKLAKLEKQWTKLYDKVINSNNRTIRIAASGRLRAHITTSKPTTSLGDGKTRCELDPETFADLASITADGDKAIVKLNFLQEWVSSHAK